MIDSQRLVHLPRSARIAALGLIVVTLVLAVAVVARFMHIDDPASPRFTDWILVGMSLVHLALSGLAVALVLFYSEREANAALLESKLADILDRAVPRVLARVTAHHDLRHLPSTVDKLGSSDIFGAAYRIHSGDHSLNAWVGLNVSRLFAIFWIAVPEHIDDVPGFVDGLRTRFEFTFAGAAEIGYHTHYEVAELNSERIVSIWSSVDSQHNLLLEPSRRVFWLQDLAMMIESFWRTALRNGLKTSEHVPAPL